MTSMNIEAIKEALCKYLERFDANYVSEIENDMNIGDKISLVYLLFDDPKQALQCLGKCSQSKVITNWCIDLTKKNQREWKLRVVESLYLMQNFKCLKRLGYNQRDLADVMNILDQAHRKKEFDSRKLLFKNFDSLTCDEIKRVIQYVDGEEMTYGRPDLYKPEYIEMYLLQWQLDSKIDICHPNKISRIMKHLNLNFVSTTSDFSVNDQTDCQGNQVSKRSYDNLSLMSATITHPIQRGHSFKEFYPIIDADNVGLCVIVNLENYKYKYLPRKGSSLDVIKLQKTMSNMKIKSTVLKDLNHDQIFPSIEAKIDQHFNPSIHSLLFVVIMAHGTKGFLEGIDGKTVETDKIRDSLSIGKCPKLIDKPKVIIFQCCRGDYHFDTKIVTDGPEEEICTVKTSMKDYLICQSTIPGFKSYRSPEKGSLYIQLLCQCLDESYTVDSIYDILHKVNRQFNDQKLTYNNKVVTITSEFVSGLNKELYLVQK